MVPKIYQFELGSFQCVIAGDASNQFVASELIVNADEGLLEEALRQVGLHTDEIPTDSKCLLVRSGELDVLVDAGWGTRLSPPEGQMLQGLSTLGVEPSDIDVIVITHADGDHIAGLLDRQGKLVFSNARYVMWRGARDYWAAEQSAADWPTERVDFVRETYASIEDRVQLVEAEAEFLPGFRLIPAVGHKPDHCALRVVSKGEQLLHLADAVIHPLFMVYPGWYSTFDFDAQQVVQDRQQLLAWASAERMLLFAAHFPFPGLGTIQPQGQGWQWQAV